MSVDPDGTSRPLGGIRWVTDGVGLAECEDVILEFDLEEQFAPDMIDAYVFHTETMDYVLLILDLLPPYVPTLPHWGVVVMLLSVVTAGAIVFRRRRAA